MFVDSLENIIPFKVDPLQWYSLCFFLEVFYSQVTCLLFLKKIRPQLLLGLPILCFQVSLQKRLNSVKRTLIFEIQ